MKIQIKKLASVTILISFFVCQGALALTPAQNKQIEEIAQTIAEQHNANSKSMLDDVTVSTHAVAIAKNVQIEFVLRLKKNIPSEKMREWADGTRSEIISRACQTNANNPAFDRGLYYTFVYANMYGEKLIEFVVDKATCKH
ncbi:hypothetical protein [Desulfocastanea catecholica]